MKRLVLSTILFGALLCAAPLIADCIPTHVCPQYIWGQTGNVYHWYSEYIEVQGENCTSCGWDNYDGGPDEPTGGTCGNVGQCRPLSLLENQVGMRATKAVVDGGLHELPEPAVKPQLGPTATMVDSRIVDVAISPTKVIKVRLSVVWVDPRVEGKSLPPIMVMLGHEVRYNPSFPPTAVVPTRDVQGGGNHYRIRIGAAVYQVVTHQEP